MIRIEMFKDIETEDLSISIKVPRSHQLQGRTSAMSRAMAERIDMEQFFGMLRDAVDMKLGLELERGATS